MLNQIGKMQIKIDKRNQSKEQQLKMVKNRILSHFVQKKKLIRNQNQGQVFNNILIDDEN